MQLLIQFTLNHRLRPGPNRYIQETSMDHSTSHGCRKLEINHISENGNKQANSGKETEKNSTDFLKNLKEDEIGFVPKMKQEREVAR